jgi:hypothetical protein
MRVDAELYDLVLSRKHGSARQTWHGHRPVPTLCLARRTKSKLQWIEMQFNLRFLIGREKHAMERALVMSVSCVCQSGFLRVVGVLLEA